MNSIRSQQILRFIASTLGPKRFSTDINSIIERQSELFSLEQKRQRQDVGRIEKIEIQYESALENASLYMNKNISTPYDCAKHIGETVANKSAVALLNGQTYWHMHKPLASSCKIEFLHYNQPNPYEVNKAFWRTCSFLLGALATNAFKDSIEVQLHSFPIPNVRSGSFVYDIQLSLENWVPKPSELRALSLSMIKSCQEANPIECLDVSAELALLIFDNNPHKTLQIPDIAAHNNGIVTLFRAGHHVDISKGPMIANTNQLGRITIANVIKLDTDISGSPIYRFQGVALPSSIILSHFAYNLLEERAKELNPARIPGTQNLTLEENHFASRFSN